jgi:hypothetical protein
MTFKLDFAYQQSTIEEKINVKFVFSISFTGPSTEKSSDYDVQTNYIAKLTNIERKKSNLTNKKY